MSPELTVQRALAEAPISDIGLTVPTVTPVRWKIISGPTPPDAAWCAALPLEVQLLTASMNDRSQPPGAHGCGQNQPAASRWLNALHFNHK